MTKTHRGFSLIELLVYCSIAALTIGGICIYMAIGLQLTYYNIQTLLRFQQAADFWFLLHKDISHAGYGLSIYPALRAFPFVRISTQQKIANSITIFSNMEESQSALIRPALPATGNVYIRKMKNISEGDWAILTEIDNEKGVPKWAVIKVLRVRQIDNLTTECIVTLIETGPYPGSNKFNAGARFLKVQKISYCFDYSSNRIDRVIDDRWRQPVLSSVVFNSYSFCSIPSQPDTKNCIEFTLQLSKGEDNNAKYHHSIFLPNI